MKALFLGGLAARVAPRILGKMSEKLDTTVLAELSDLQRLMPALAEAEIVVGHIWRPDFPEAPRLKLLQAATAGVDMIDLPSLPRGITLCNVFGHEPAIAEYVLMTILSLTHRLVETVTAFRGGSWAGTSPPADRRTARYSGKRSGSSAMGGSVARSQSAPPASAAKSSPPTGPRYPTKEMRQRFTHWASSIECCRNRMWF
jgi:lactate dehydrogenase-like 2-hydroxyacid dehydrogenase